jgi:thioredoxin 2
MARAAQKPRCGECRKPIPLDHPLMVNDQNFDRVISAAAVPVLVDFYADWCGPCKMMAPVLDRFAQERAGELLVLQLDTEQSRQVSQRFQIRSIPTLIIFRNGREVARELGAVPAQRLAALAAKAASPD